METVPRKIDHLCRLVEIELLKPDVTKDGDKVLIEGLGLCGELVDITLINADVPDKVYNVTITIEEV